MSESNVRYELIRDQMEQTYTIRRVEDIGPFATREDARQYMLDTVEERKARDGR
jgi:hypothetical protein